MSLDHLHATPYITTAGDRTSDLLGWCRMRTAWQRRLFPMFTVLTWSRDFAETSLAMRVAALDCDRPVNLTVLRDLEVLFGPASLEAPDLDRTGNPLRILNIERIRDYREAHKGRPLSVSDAYRTNLSYGPDPTTGAPCEVSVSSASTAAPCSKTSSAPDAPGGISGVARSSEGTKRIASRPPSCNRPGFY